MKKISQLTFELSVVNAPRRVVTTAILLFLAAVAAYAQCSAPSYGATPSSCSGGSVTFSAQSTGLPGGTTSVTHRYYTASTGGSPVATISATEFFAGTWASQYVTSVSATTTFWVSTQANSCSESTTRKATTFTLTQPGVLSINNGGVQPNLCAGSSMTLTPQGGSSYSWSSSPSGASGSGAITVSPTVTTTYTLNGVESVCGSSAAPVSLTINVSPAVGTVSITSGPTAFCQGTVSNSTFGATASNVGYYQWSVSPAGAGTMNVNTGAITWNAGFSGTAVVSVIAYSGPYCTTTSNTSRNVEIYPAVANATMASTSISAFCGPVTITGTNAGGNEGFRWYTAPSGGSGTYFATSFTTSTLTAGTYYYYVSKYNSVTGCESSTRTQVTITINPFSSYTLGGNGAYCTPAQSGATLTLSGSQAGVTYELVRNGTPTGTTMAGTGSALTFPVQSTVGTYSVRALNNGNCPTNMTGSVTVVATPSSVGGSTLPANSYFYTYPDAASGTLSVSGQTGSVTHVEYNGGAGWVSTPYGATSWNFGNIFATIQYRAVVQSGTCPAANSSIATIYVYAKPVISGSSVIPCNSSIALSTTSYYSYQWLKNDVVISGATSSSYNTSEPGVYKVRVKGSASAPDYTSDAFVVSLSFDAQVNVNFHKVTEFKQPGFASMPQLNTLSLSQISQAVEYSDGLARPIQQIAAGQSPLQKDIIAPGAYDRMGRAAISYLPYTGTSSCGLYRPDALNPNPLLSEQRQFYATATGTIANSNSPFAETVFDASPMSMTRTVGAPGDDWQVVNNHTVRTTLMVNLDNTGATDAIKNVKKWTTAGPTGSNYAIGDLFVTRVIDENNNEVFEFTDKLGRSILKRVQLSQTVEGINTEYLNTYYVYDNLGRLAIQVPPKAVTKLDNGSTWNATFQNDWCFTYTYDNRGRLVEQKAPGAAPTYYIYDTYDRLVLTQDGILRSANKWLFIKYDYKDRPVMTGLYLNATTTVRSTLQTEVEGFYAPLHPTYPVGAHYESRGVTLHGYSNVSFPKLNKDNSAIEVLSVNYFDGYDFDFNGTADYSYTSQSLAGEHSQGTAFGMPTGSKRRILGSASSWITAYVFYDKLGRVIQTRSGDHMSLQAGQTGANSLVTNIYDHENKVTKFKRSHINYLTGTNISVEVRMEYDHAGRPLKVYQKYSSQSVEQLVAEYVYNELGQLVDKKLHNTGGSNYLQSIDYRYNIRGWLTSINNATFTNDGQTNDDANDYFGMELAYEKVDTELGNVPYYNGNISATKWKGIGAAADSTERRAYKFTYDKADRLKQAKFQMYGSSAWDQEVNTLNERMLYDNNGNILSLARRQNQRSTASNNFLPTDVAAVIDSLTYTYATGNQLSKVEDVGTNAGFVNGANNVSDEYTYNQNGSLITDKNKGISLIEYNELGKPKKITYSDGRFESFDYDGAGGKLTARTHANTGVLMKRIDYIDGFQFENSELVYQPSPEGRVARKGTNLLSAGISECTTTSGFTPSNATLTAVSQNGGSYLKVTSTPGTSAPGVYIVSGLAVAPSTRYVFKVKGYAQSGAERPRFYVYTNIGAIMWSPVGPGLPVGAANEDWTAYEFVTQAGATTIDLRVLWWNSTASAQDFFLNDIEFKAAADEYQYTIPDHQGNTRVVFSSVMGTPVTSTANMESSTNADFPNYSSVFRFNLNLYDKTDAGSTYTYSNLLNGGNNQRIGVAKSYKVLPGDKVKIEAWAKYSNPTGTATNISNFTSALLSAFGVSAPGVGETATMASGLNNYAGLVVDGDGPDAYVKAFVNIIVFDKNYNLIDFAYEAIDPAANQEGASPVIAHDHMISEYTIKEAGYAFLYVSNESPTRVDVYFDDITMTHTPGNVIQYNEYYPFGMRTASSWDRIERKSMSSLQTNLVLQMPFDEDLKDKSGSNNHGTASGNTVTGQTNQGRDKVAVMDGTGDYVTITDNASLDFGSSDFTVAIWTRKLAATASGDNMHVIGKWNWGGTAGTNEWALTTSRDGSNNKPGFYLEQGTTMRQAESNDDLVVGQWYHIVGQRQGTSMKLYVNGILKATTNIGTGAVNNTAYNLLIAKAQGAGNESHAAYDDLYIYKRALSEDEIRYLYQDKPELMVNDYLYNSASEYDATSGWYDTFFRSYDPVLGRFHQVDPKAGKYAGLTPYNYALNSPIVLNDPMGDDVEYQNAAADRIYKLATMGFATFFDMSGISEWGYFQVGARSVQGGGVDARANTAWSRYNVAQSWNQLLNAISKGFDAIANGGSVEVIDGGTVVLRYGVGTYSNKDNIGDGIYADTFEVGENAVLAGRLAVSHFQTQFSAEIDAYKGGYNLVTGLMDGDWDKIKSGGLEMLTLIPYGKALKVLKLAKYADKLFDAAKGGYSTIYRAVSKAELDDIAKFGFRNKAGAYETGKLFAPTLEEAAKFGKNNFMFDGIPNTIMKVRVPNNVLNGAYRFPADGMNAISIPSNQLNLLRGTPLNYSPFIH